MAISDILGASNNKLTLPTLDTAALGAYYSSGVSLGESLHAKTIDRDILRGSRFVGESVIPPWTLPEAKPADSQEALQQIFSSSKLIDLNDPRVQRNGDDENFKNLFALYNALEKMRSLVSFAESDAKASFYGRSLQSRFEDQLAQVHNFVGNLNITGAPYDATLLYGVRQTTQTSTVNFPKSTAAVSPYHIGAVVSDVRNDPIAGLAGTESFDITVNQSGVDTVVNIDLSAVSGTLNVDNIADYINSQLSAAGVLSTVKVKRFDEFAYGFEFDISSTESLTFGNASDTSGAVYIAGTNNVGDASSGFLKKIDDLANTAPNEVFRSEIDTSAADSASAVAVDSAGNVYTVGTTAGDLENEANQGTTDAYLRKYDAAGNLIWSRLLGATDQASGFAVAVDANDNVVIAGQVQGQLSNTAYGGNYDSFVTKFDGSGIEQWTRQAAPYANDGALALTTDGSGNIFVAGYTQGAIDGSASYGGATDGYLTKLDTDGTLQWNQQFGGTGTDRATAIAVDGSGNVFVAGSNNGEAVVRKYADAGSSASLTWEADAGTLNSGDAVSGLALGADGAVYLAGTTSNTGLNGTITQAHSGGTDGFVTRIDDAGSSASVNYTSYIGSSANDTIGGIAVRAASGADEIYVTGGTTGSIDGSAVATTQDLYAAKLNNAGTSDWTKQFNGSFTHAGNAIAFDDAGTSVLSRLGLPTGTVPVSKPSELTALTSARAGQSFRISVNGGAESSVTIEADDSLGFLAFKIKKILGQDGKVTVQDGIDSKTLTIEAKNGAVVDLIAGPNGFDALGSLGLSAGRLYGQETNSEGDDKSSDSIFELGLFDNLRVDSKAAATDSGIIIDNALREIRSIYRYINFGPDEASNGGLPDVSAADAAKIANLQQTLNSISLLNQQNQVGAENGAPNLFNLIA